MRSRTTWRELGESIAQGIIEDEPEEGWTRETLRKALSKGYPWGERARHPYKIWLSIQADLVRHMFQVTPSEEEQLNFGLFGKMEDEE